MSRKPDIFKCNIGNVNNNSKVYYSFLEDRLGIEVEPKSKEDPIDFINKLSKSGSYIFNKEVVVKTKDKTYNTKIAGKLGDRLVTLDNESIYIKDIIDIYEK